MDRDVARRVREHYGRPDYASLPVDWVASTMPRTHLWSKQREVLQAIADHPRTVVRSCHSSGKSFDAAIATAWWIDAHPPGEAFVLTTAPTNDQVKAILWKEIHRACKRAGLAGELNQREWYIGSELVAMGRKPNDYDPSAFQGIHARYILIIMDEACGIPKSLYDAAETLATNRFSRVLAIGNPDDATSHFASLFKENSPWHTIKIAADDTPNFTDEDVPEDVKEVLLDPDWVERRRLEWGEDSPLYVSKVLAEFPTDAPDALVPTSKVAQANHLYRTIVDDLPLSSRVGGRLGLDPARYGTDKTVCWHAYGAGEVAVCEIVLYLPQGDTMDTANHAVRLLKERQAGEVRVDGDGLGAGVVDRLLELNEPCLEMRGGKKAVDEERFFNARAEWYWRTRDLFMTNSVAVQPSDQLLSQLTSIRWGVDSKGRIRIETKDEMKARGAPSPDHADALVYTLALAPMLEAKKRSYFAPVGGTKTSPWRT